MKKEKILRFNLINILLTVIFILLGLMLNISTASLNEKTQSITNKLKKIRLENNNLYLEITSKKSYENLEQIAQTRLNLKPIKQIKYIVLK